MILLKDVCKEYKNSIDTVKALKHVTLSIPENKIVGIVGPSGSGKSTLLQVMGLFEPPTTGEIHFEGVNLSNLTDVEKNKLRSEKIGFIFQQYQLLPSITAIENIVLPIIGFRRKKETIEKAEFLLEKVGLVHKRNKFPFELSGGEQQRVAIARSLINDPSLLLADELTGNLDYETTTSIMEFLSKLNREESITIIMVTHNLELLRYTDKNYEIKNGELHKEEIKDRLIELH